MLSTCAQAILAHIWNMIAAPAELVRPSLPKPILLRQIIVGPAPAQKREPTRRALFTCQRTHVNQSMHISMINLSPPPSAPPCALSVVVPTFNEEKALMAFHGR